MLKLTLILVVILTITGCSTLKQRVPVFNAEKRVFICFDEYDKPILLLTTTITKRSSKMALARYNYAKQRREIVLSYTLISKIPNSVLELIAYHECGHHSLQHVNPTEKPEPIKMWSNELMVREAQADCFAVNTYIQNNGRDEFNNLIETLKEIKFISNKKIKQLIICSK